jgi:hypothetical protein
MGTCNASNPGGKLAIARQGDALGLFPGRRSL